MKPPRPILPFPIPLHIGTDICRVSRILSILTNPKRGRRFVDRVLSPEERGLRRVRSALGEGYWGKEAWRGGDVGVAEFVAGRFAAKEAAFKAHPFRRLTFHDIVIRPTSDGEESGPIVAVIRGEEVDQMAMVSISHDGDYATAVCLGFDPTRKQPSDR
ncbi:hypothetical protein SAPIO_CDS7337 [Scedosporium apiospermum]|uniref:4'-phosphopantetheinyl transferase domain-containing protein n=1 Tax=Pseudallescheria apiosperma TaxID=563466 RepID=A0A084G1N5_PSEDA|nr:uncharacterized protein SAPIO_CDS7337 [Scedosporium apiospermum]KEZ41247.1 hypothetical protein SAPIO_CDS7337 [Scedosporium apiospermum]